MTPQRTSSFLLKTPIRFRLMLVIGLLMLGVVSIFVGASYYGVRDAAFAVGRERLRGLTDQLSTLFQQQARSIMTLTRTVADTQVVRQYVRTGDARLRPDVLAMLERIGPPRDSISIVELWSARKSFMLGLSHPVPFSDAPLDSEFVQAAGSPERGMVGALHEIGDTLYYPVVIAMLEKGKPFGYLVRWRRFSSNQQAVDQLSRLLGTQAALYFANSDGSVWTDLLTTVEAPPLDMLNERDIVQYERPGHGEVVASARAVQGTPWVLLIEFSHDEIMSTSSIFLQGIPIAGAVLLLVGLVVAWFLSRTFTKPIGELTVATDALARGDFSRPVQVNRKDEIGKLAFAFNAMAERIQSSQREIEHRDVQIGKKSSELTQSEERYRHLFQSNPLPMWVFDVETLAFLAVNNAAIDKYGYGREEFLSMTIKDIRPSEEQQRLLDDLAQHHTGMDKAGTWKHTKKDGTVIDVEITSHEVEFAGRAAKLVLANDITEKLLAEAAVIDSEERYRVVAETASDGIITIDEASTILFANNAIRKVFGYTPDEIIGRQLTLLMPEYLRHVHKAAVERYLSTGKKHITWEGIELPGLHKNGKEIPLEVSFGEHIKDGKHTFIGIIRDISERKKAEARFKLAIDSLPNGMVIVDDVGKISLVNKEAERMFGYTREELIGKGIEILIPERFRKHHVAFRADFAAEPEARSMGSGRDLFGLRKDGTEFPLEIGLNPIEIDGKTHVLSSIVDITERKHAEERFRVAVESAPNGMVIVDQSGGIVLVNSEAERLFGYSREEIVGKPIEMLVPQRFRKAHTMFRSDYTKTPQTRSMGAGRDLYGLRKDGTEFPLEIGLNPIEISEKKHILGSIVDITERKRTEEALLINEKHNESLLRFSKQASQAQTFSAILSAALTEVRFVLGYHNVWAYLFAEDGETASLITIAGGVADAVNNEVPVLQVKGDKMIEEIYHGERPVIVEDARTDPRTNKDIVNALQNRTIINVPMMLADRKLGALGTGSFGEEGVRVPSKEQVEYFTTMASRISIAFNRIQLTEQRERAYEEIRQLNEDLERRVAERTALLEAANKELESFSYSVSHDLRAPLRGIEGFSRLVLEDYAATLDDEGKRFLGNIIANTSKMGQLIDDLLAFSRLSRQELRVWTVDMMNMAQSIATDVSRLEQNHTVHLIVKSLPPMVCDGSMLRQVWLNLISNAYKFTRRVDTPRVEIGSYEENGERIYYVKDNGAGFDMKYYDKLFGVFQRLHRQDEFEGTGVGLGIVQRVINRHGGRVWAEAEINKGATFYFSLPHNGR